jgi:hypothetical protein
MPIRRGGMLAKRASTWPRDHFWRTALIEADDVERVFTDIDADYGYCDLGCRRHGVLLVWASLANLALAGQEHGRTILLAVIR